MTYEQALPYLNVGMKIRHLKVDDDCQGNIDTIIGLGNTIRTIRFSSHVENYPTRAELEIIENPDGSRFVLEGSQSSSDSESKINHDEPIVTKKGFMETIKSIVQSVKAQFSPTDRALVKAGFLDENGKRTPAYETELLLQAQKKLIEDQDTPDFRTQLAAALTEDKK